MRMVKRLLRVLLVLLLLVVVAGGVGFYLLRATPAFFQPYQWPAQQRSVANQEAVDKLMRVQNLAAESQALERRRQLGSTETRPANQLVSVSLTEAQLNALIQHNLDVAWREARYQQHVADPTVLLRDGRIILAGRVPDFGGTIASAHLEPVLREGKLQVVLSRVMAGRLRLPGGLLGGQLERFRASLLPRLSQWQREATIDSTGSSNSSVVAAAMTQLLVTLLDGKAAEPVVFVPIGEGGKSAPLRLTELRVGDRVVDFTVQVMSPAERAELLKRVRGTAARP